MKESNLANGEMNTSKVLLNLTVGTGGFELDRDFEYACLDIWSCQNLHNSKETKKKKKMKIDKISCSKHEQEVQHL